MPKSRWGEKKAFNLIWEAVGDFSKKISQLWIGFSKSQTSSQAQRSLQPRHKLISLLGLHSFKPQCRRINPEQLQRFPLRSPVQQWSACGETVQPVRGKHTRHKSRIENYLKKPPHRMTSGYHSHRVFRPICKGSGCVILLRLHAE